MKEFKAIFKTLAKEKKNTAADMFQLCIFKAMTAKSALTYEERVQIAYNLLTKAFTPITNANKLKNGMRPYSKLFWSLNQASNISYCLETESERASYSRLETDISHRFYNKETEKYTFIFINKQLPTKQYMLVQSNHVCFELGKTLALEGFKTNGLNFVVCGASSEQHLLDIDKKIRDTGFKTIKFIEPDINNTTTAIASYPIGYKEKGFLREYQLLRLE